MHIVCPTCSASYEVPDQLMRAGRVVRCSRCNGEWTPVAPEALPEAEPVPAPPSMEPAPSFEPEAPPPLPPEPAPAEPETIGVVRRSAMDRLAAHPATARPSVALRLAWAGSIAALILLAAVAFVWRSEIIALWPPSARAYSALGLHSQPETRQ
jgi:predicted Zn finger-like uncharacterized protein